MRHFHVSVVEVKVKVEAAVVYRVTQLHMLISILHCVFEEDMSLRLIVTYTDTPHPFLESLER